MSNPYIIGPPVRGVNFYGRQFIISYVLSASEDNFWVVGTRRIGKTSLLREIQLTATPPWIPIFHSLEGTYSSKKAAENFQHEVMYNSVFNRYPHEILNSIRWEDMFSALNDLEALTNSKGLRLLLLLDEADWIPTISSQDDANNEFINNFRRLAQQISGLRIIITSSPLLINRLGGQSKLLQRFSRKNLSNLEEAEAEALIQQSKNLKPLHVSKDTVHIISEMTGGHPFLIQYLCNRLYQDKKHTLKYPQEIDLRIDSILSSIIKENLTLISELQQQLLIDVIKQGSVSKEQITNNQLSMDSLNDLIELGYLREVSGLVVIGNVFIKKYIIENFPVNKSEIDSGDENPDLNLKNVWKRRVNELVKNIDGDMKLLHDYENKIRYEDDPRQRDIYNKAINELFYSAERHRQEYKELELQLSEPPHVWIDDVHRQLETMDIRLREVQSLLINKVTPLQEILLARYNDRETEIIQKAIYQLEYPQLLIVREVLEALDTGRVTIEDMESLLMSVKQSAMALAKKEVPLPSQNLVSEVIDSPKLDINHKIKITIPIIPLLLNYESELGFGSSANLEDIWNKLLVKLKRGK
jgi:hypothetical protein